MLTVLLYRKGQAVQTEVNRFEMMQALKDKEALLWVDLEEPSDFESEVLAEVFAFHPLAIEDCLNELSYPKMDDYDEHIFLVLNGAVMKKDDKGVEELHTVELDAFLGANFVVTFHKEPVSSIRATVEACRKKASHYMGQGPDFLLYTIMDQFVDAFQPLLQYFDDQVEAIEELVCQDVAEDFLENLMQLKKDIFKLRRMVMPQRDVVNYMTRYPNSFIPKKRVVYFRDVYDHLVRVHETADGFHESLNAALQAYFSHSSHKLNDVMKRLTVLATLAMPMLMIASMYGMNFRHMPELEWKYGYPMAMGIMFGISAAMLVWMKKKKWI